ncbi:hypothetical protein ACFWR9_11705 [Streptomyces sp. NPDC058534]|uniref:hypothetical protein n=1 Tax=Streptomyces sp. NPDC058534 TaxID=3346541 RepID=UPI003653466F
MVSPTTPCSDAAVSTTTPPPAGELRPTADAPDGAARTELAAALRSALRAAAAGLT